MRLLAPHEIVGRIWWGPTLIFRYVFFGDSKRQRTAFPHPRSPPLTPLTIAEGFGRNKSWLPLAPSIWRRARARISCNWFHTDALESLTPHHHPDLGFFFFSRETNTTAVTIKTTAQIFFSTQTRTHMAPAYPSRALQKS